MLTVGSLFAGIGGFDLGFERAGMRTAWQVEIDAACRGVLARHFPQSERFVDIRDCGAHNLQSVDVICGGFPCQDLSVAGKRAGLSGARSGLFYEMVRIIDELRPAFLVWENVPVLLSSDDGRDFARVLVALAGIGYHGAWRVLNAKYFGVAQHRRRVFGVFARGDTAAGRAAEILALADGLRGHPAACREAGTDVAGTAVDGPDVCGALTTGVARPDDNKAQAGHLVALSPTLRAMNHAEGHANGGGQVAIAEGGEAGFIVRRLTPLECERLQGFPDGWTDGQADSTRYRQLGNAVCVNVAEWLGKRVKSVGS